MRPNPFQHCISLPAHFDGGSMATTTDFPYALWYYCEFNDDDPPQAPLEVADQQSHYPIGFGFLAIPSSDPSGHTFVYCLLTPSLPATIVSPFSVGLQYNARGYSCITNFDTRECSIVLCSRDPSVPNLSFPQHLHRGLLFSHPILYPNKQ
jgi:hypothetical protein